MADKIKVEKCGLIIGVNRYTQIPLAALALAECNMMFPAEAKRQEFECTHSSKTNEDNPQCENQGWDIKRA